MSDLTTDAKIRWTEAGGNVAMGVWNEDDEWTSTRTHPLGGLTRFVMRCCYVHSSAVLFGSDFVNYMLSGFNRRGWQKGIHYHPSRIEVCGGLTLVPPASPDSSEERISSGFFRHCGLDIIPEDFDQAIVLDAICILTNYRGPDQLDELLDGLRQGVAQDQIILRLLSVCDALIWSEDDGFTLRGCMASDLIDEGFRFESA